MKTPCHPFKWKSSLTPHHFLPKLLITITFCSVEFILRIQHYNSTDCSLISPKVLQHCRERVEICSRQTKRFSPGVICSTFAYMRDWNAWPIFFWHFTTCEVTSFSSNLNGKVFQLSLNFPTLQLPHTHNFAEWSSKKIFYNSLSHCRKSGATLFAIDHFGNIWRHSLFTHHRSPMAFNQSSTTEGGEQRAGKSAGTI